MATEYFREQISSVSRFHRDMVDRFIKNQVPMLDNLNDCTQGLCLTFINTWKGINIASESVHGVELAIFLPSARLFLSRRSNCRLVPSLLMRKRILNGRRTFRRSKVSLRQLWKTRNITWSIHV
ncbi:hypothetical protein PMAYCL1PPCAC_19881 [Pristionchus mayeri]|uniref:Uncharacterized protein n=1 Tax=Pristionchus mayeri TaxID=1317129 RepID=A0AAN5CRZ1_9BILA|nr:hypothetical protein PMAYCL1PPCAC_19881 [Pristionchus mayeri]